MELKGKRTLVMGLGLHDGGLGVTRFLVEQGAEVTVTDLRSAEVLRPTLEKLAGLPINYVLGEHREEDFRQAELVIKNPAVPREAGLLRLAQQAGASIEMELTLFFKLCPSPFILGITGTRGKTTTTLLAGAMFKAWQADTVVAGNLRVSALAKLAEIGPHTPVILELSSWQLEGLGEQQLSPPYAVVTNLSPDHLNRYCDMEDYAQAKRNIYRWQKGAAAVVVLNLDDPLVSRFAEDAPQRVSWFSTQPLPVGKNGAYLHEGNLIWRDPAKPEIEQVIVPATTLKVPGQHNLQNALAAISLARLAGCPLECIRTGLENFKGLPDRLELVREVDGIRFYNDTTATSPAGVVAALEALRSVSRSEERRIILIAGGADKQLDFTPMARAIANPINRVAHLVLLDGTATPRLVMALEDAGVSASKLAWPFDDFSEAIATAQALAKKDDLVLLSPGCASFGMFTHEFERGEQFREIVGKL
ncbi:MAG: UDP-N-acetylmuramoyl-L-alanine--D-glutamate ligase [Chloroflexota bacterium]